MAVLCLIGGGLLTACGAGVGFILASMDQNKWRTAHAFTRLLEYTRDSIRYRGCPAEEVLSAAAAYPEFARLGLAQCYRFAEVPVPGVFELAVRQELQTSLIALESCGRESACQTLDGMLCLCRPREETLHAGARISMRLYPRLGGCMGILTAILLI